MADKDTDLTADTFAEEVAAMDPGPPHIRRRRNTAEDDPVRLGQIMFTGILDRRILPALDRAHRDELLRVHLSGDGALDNLGVSATFSNTAC